MKNKFPTCLDLGLGGANRSRLGGGGEGASGVGDNGLGWKLLR